jgi:uracil-DNA glycosylase family protein
MVAPAVHPAELVPPGASLATAGLAAYGCQACELWERATQTVFGEGPIDSPLVLAGEQPGDREDVEGHVFVGPAGRVLDEALESAGIDREKVFITNVVKHFRWRPSGKRRLHERPTTANVRACRPWFDLELEMVRPNVVVALGATATRVIIGPDAKLTEIRGTIVEPDGPDDPLRLATIHPSAILRMRTPEERAQARDQLALDLGVAAAAAGM